MKVFFCTWAMIWQKQIQWHFLCRRLGGFCDSMRKVASWLLYESIGKEEFFLKNKTSPVYSWKYSSQIYSGPGLLLWNPRVEWSVESKTNVKGTKVDCSITYHLRMSLWETFVRLKFVFHYTRNKTNLKGFVSFTLGRNNIKIKAFELIPQKSMPLISLAQNIH